MEDKEKLKALDLARAGEIFNNAIDGNPYVFPAVGDYTLSKDMRNGDWKLDYYRSGSIYYSFSSRHLASDPVWALVAPILGIQIGK